MKFYKMQGAGNDFIFVEDFNFEIKDECNLAKQLCNRHFGIGADGLVIVRKSDVSEAKMIIINSDGSRANMCGNAIRCFGKYVYEKNIVDKTKFSVETGDGVKEIEIILEDNKTKYVRVYMGEGSYNGADIPLNNLENLSSINLNDFDLNKTGLFIVDMNNGFAKEGALSSPRVEKIIKPIADFSKVLSSKINSLVGFT